MIAQVDEDIRYSYKVIVIGDSGVGKSSLIIRATHNRFNLNTKPTIGVDFASKEIQIDDKVVHGQLWDTAGQEKYQAVMPAMYRGAHGCIIVFDITNRESFENAGKWATQLMKYGEQDCKKIVIGNKCDLHHLRQVSIEEATEYAKSIDSAYMETSALSAHNVELAFNSLLKEVHKRSLVQMLNPTRPTNVAPPTTVNVADPPTNNPPSSFPLCNC